MSPLSIADNLEGKRILVYGGTGFLGKVCLSLILSRFPNVGHIYFIVRSRRDQNNNILQGSQQRFYDEIITSDAFSPLRKNHPGSLFTEFCGDKITVLDGDVTIDFAGLSTEVRSALRGKVDVLLNISGVVDFNPPLDRSLEVNAFGMKNLVALCKDLGDVAMLHTSTCYVAGDRTGQVNEEDPRHRPFPKSNALDPKHWDPEREIQECTEMIHNAKKRSRNAFRQSSFLDKARRNLEKKGEPTRGKALDNELERVERRFVEDLMIAEGTERANFWGWHNIYTYTKSIGEQILTNSGLQFCIVRPAVIESALSFPQVGWNEGINTSAPLIYLAHQGPLKVPASPDSVLDVIPVDLVAFGTTIALGELLNKEHKTIYQLGTSDSSPLKMHRLIEVVELHRRIDIRKNPGNPLIDAVKRNLIIQPVNVPTYFASGPTKRAEQLRTASKWLAPLKKTPLSAIGAQLDKTLTDGAKTLDAIAKITDQFIPFTATHNYRFSCQNIRQAFQRLSPEERERLPWKPEELEWRHYLLNIHCPGLKENVFPLIEEKRHRAKKPLRAYDHLIDLLDEIADRHGNLPAVMRTHNDGLSQLSYIEFRKRVHGAAEILASGGLKRGDRVLLSGANHPYWSICYFGILCAGGVAVPLDVALTREQAINIEVSSGAKVSILDLEASDAFGDALNTQNLSMRNLAENPSTTAKLHRPKTDDLASILYTSGTTGHPKGVMLTHGNFTAMLASLANIFPLNTDDRVLSVLPLHHTFEFSCGLLLPLSRGTPIIYIDELTGERISHGLNAGKVSAMVGVPALWQLLERRMQAQINERGKLFSMMIESAMRFNRNMGKQTGVDLGRLLFSSVHNKMGGNIRYLISGGAALPKETHAFFSGLGLHLTEGYGLTEAAPVLTVSKGGPGTPAGKVGKPIPGVQIKIDAPDENGVGQVLARGQNVMQGYFGNASATEKTLDQDGWLHTGDMGKLDAKGRLILSGRAKEVVISASGENIYLDDVEQMLGTISHVKEYVLVGLINKKGSESLGLLARLDDESDLEKSILKIKADDSIRERIKSLPHAMRPTITAMVDADLPRTRTRKIKRAESAHILKKIHDATEHDSEQGVEFSLAKTLASVTGVDEKDIYPTTTLESLGFDSLMSVELSSALNAIGYKHIDIEALQECRSVQEILTLIGSETVKTQEKTSTEEIELPKWLANAMKGVMTSAQKRLYDTLLKTKVKGRSNIPLNQRLIVISNHTSHLDMGLIKFALGDYGKDIVGLAAQDYFFEGNKWKVAYFKNVTNLAPINRKKGYRVSLKQAKKVLEAGHNILMFPEGTRQTSGQLNEFKPMIGQLALETKTNILPLFINGAFDAMPKGQAFPSARQLEVTIGPVIDVENLSERLGNLKPSQLIRAVAKSCHLAIEMLRDGKQFDSRTADLTALLEKESQKKPVEHPILAKLKQCHQPDQVKKSLTWYFSLGGKSGPRYTVTVNGQDLSIRPGKPVTGSADCVIKTSEEMFRKMIMEAYVPQMAEFLGGKIKTNAPNLLLEFQRIFNLKANQ